MIFLSWTSLKVATRHGPYSLHLSILCLSLSLCFSFSLSTLPSPSLTPSIFSGQRILTGTSPPSTYNLFGLAITSQASLTNKTNSQTQARRRKPQEEVRKEKGSFCLLIVEPPWPTSSAPITTALDMLCILARSWGHIVPAVKGLKFW